MICNTFYFYYINRAFLTIATVFILFHSALSQITVSKHYKVSDGLPSTILYSILQDKKGIIWIGTANGVSTYDGNSFINLGLKDGLTENEIIIVKEDSRERKWLIPYGSYLAYHKDGKIVNRNNFALFDRKLELARARGIFEDSNHTIWINGPSSLLRVRDTSIKKIPHATTNIFGLYETSDHQLRVIDGNGIFLVEKDSSKYIYKAQPSLTKNLTLQVKTAFFYEDKIIFYGNKFLAFVEIKNDSLVLVKELNPEYLINLMKIDKYNNLWTLTAGDGALCINYATKDTLHFLPGKSVSDVLIDSENNIWFTTIDDGLFKFNTPFVRIFDQTTGLSGNSIHSVHVSDDGEVYAGLDNSKLARVKGNKIHEITVNKKGKCRILGIKSRNGRVYCSTDEGLHYYNPSTNEMRPLLDSIEAFKGLSINDSLLMVGCSSYGLVLNINNNASLYKHWLKSIRSLCTYKKGSYLLGTLEGLFFYKDSLVPYNKNIPGLNDVINHIIVDKTGIIWAATQNNGVVAINGNNVLNFNEANGLLANSCNHISADNKNTVWVSTNLGLNKITIKDWTRHSYLITGYTSEDGLPSNEINETCIYNDSIWIATSKGLAIINTDFTRQYIEPYVYINKIATNDSLYINPSVLKLPYSQNSLTIYYRGVSLSSANQLKFIYRLYPFEKKWNYSDNQEIQYHNLEPGNYQLVIRAIHRNGELISKPALISIYIKAPFWKTIWFYILLAILFISITLALYFSNLRKYKVKSELKNRMLQSEIKALRAQMNPHFIFNSLNSIQNFIFSHKKEDANRYLSEFSDLMRTMLSHSRKNFISIVEEITFLRTYLNLERLRLNNRFEFSFSHPDESSMSAIEIPGMIIQPFVENAVIHGLSDIDYPGKLSIEFSLENENLVCTITDNGPGYNYKNNSSQSKAHHSMGLLVTQERINALKESGMSEIEYQITDLNPAGKGTRVEILFKNVNEKVIL